MRARTAVAGTLMLVVVAAGVAPGTGSAGEGLGGGPLGRLMAGHFGRLQALHSKLNLTNEQRQQIRAVVATHRAEIAPVARDVVAKRRALRDRVLADPIDEAAIRGAAGDLSKSMGDAAVLAARVRAQIRPLLTPEQKKTFEEFRTERQGAVDQWLEDFEKGTEAQ